MLLLLLATGVFLLGGLAALSVRGSSPWCTRLGVGGAVTGCLVGLLPVAHVLLGHPTLSLRARWDVPYGAFLVELDPLSAVFLLPTFTLSALAAIYGAEYVRPRRGAGSPGASWLFFNLLVASMALVLVARNAVLFLVAWETMALASYFLVTFDDDQASVRRAGRVYLVATHLGTACLLALFLLLGRGQATLDFADFHPAAPLPLLFFLALAGFGTKAGLMPFHVWLPEAHPAAPSHVSAVMSGVMITTGIYGLVRTLGFLGPLPAWCGWTLGLIGLISALLGVLLALAQGDVKRVLAYSTVENAGIVALGLGLGLLGLAAAAPTVAVLAFAGALLHVWSHALAKGVLFLAAGAVAHATGSRVLDRLGGLLRTMPETGRAFLVGAAAITGLPPLGGFASELLLLLAAFHGASTLASTAALPFLGALAALGLVAGLAAACFARAVGIAFLGHPRSPAAARAHDPGPAMRHALRLLAGGCLLFAAFAPWVPAAMTPALVPVTGLPPDAVRAGVAVARSALEASLAAGGGLLFVVGALAALRRRLLATRAVARGLAWDCGYGAPSPRMQYTASSFAEPLTTLFAALLGTRHAVDPPAGLFPTAAAFVTHTPDPTAEYVFAPLGRVVARALAALRWLQHGRIQLYVLYITLTLLVLLLWRLG
jgi:formate hydrogenlyase subunit 3/multisubunit Na+/H+ antiporter MnhD subunit